MKTFTASVSAILLAAVSVITPTAATSYSLLKEYSGPTFFDEWTFFDHFDNLTNGDVIFVSASEAASSKLAFVDPSTNHAIIKVDNTSTVPFNEKRNTVRITTNERYGLGTVWVADLFHIPFGCSVWPAWWSQAPDWPTGGEIDTLEGVNLVTQNQMGLHTLPGCTSTNPSLVSTSKEISGDCSHLANNNSGCIVTDTLTTSYGQGFAAGGGGVYVTEYATTGISVWFVPRSKVPASFTSGNGSIDTSMLGTPSGNWPSTNCNMNQFFEPQNLIFDITLCGDFAGNPSIFSQTCPGTCYPDYVVGNGSNYATAYFEIASVRVFSSTNNNGSTSGATTGNGANTMVETNYILTLLFAVTIGGVALLFA